MLTMTTSMQQDLSEGTGLFRKRRYEDALLCLERCFLAAFARNDEQHGGEAGILLLKTLVALGRYSEALGFSVGVRELTASPEVARIATRARRHVA